jgi:hypothetical protein
MDALGRFMQRPQKALTSVTMLSVSFGLPDVAARKAHSLTGARVGLNQRSAVREPVSKYL